MKVLQINKFFYPKGGAETYLLSLISLLKKNGHQVVGFSQKNKNNISVSGEEFFIDEINLDKFYLKNILAIGRIFWSFEAKKNIKKLIKQENIDLVHLHNIYHQISPSILPAIKKAGRPIVMTVHDFKLVAPNYTLWAIKNKKSAKPLLAKLLMTLEYYFHKSIKIYRKNVDLFIAPSEFVKNKLVEAGFELNKIIVLPHFVNSEMGLALRRLADSHDNSHEEKNYIVAFGRLDASKGFDWLLKALAQITYDVKLKIIGSGPEANNLKKLVKNLKIENKVEFIPYSSQADLAAIVSQGLFAVFPSLVHETFGLGLIESYFLGKPVIAARVGAFSEIVNAQTGLLVEPGNVSELKTALETLINNKDLRLALGQNARKIAEENFTSQKHLTEINGIYDSLIQKTIIAKNQVDLEKNMFKNYLKKIILTAALLLLLPLTGLAYNLPNNQYPRTVNLYWKTPITLEEAPILAKWDLLALDMKAQVDSESTIRKIRELNPDIIILAYTTANEVPGERLKIMEPNGTGLWHDLIAGIKEEWYLKNYQGEKISYWPGNWSMNQYIKNNSGYGYNDYLVDFYDQKVLATGLWDGLLFDNVWNTVAWINLNIDIDGNGDKDSESKIDQLWQASNLDFFQKLRNRLGNKYLILGNGEGSYSDYTNGRMFESFPEFWEGGWVGSMERYRTVNYSGYQPRINIINANTNNTGNYLDSAKMRYGLASALMYDGYFSFDWGTEKREEFWWYDEFNVSLGQPKSTPINLLDKSNGQLQNSVWQRDFANGLAVVNATDKIQTINFDRDYEKIKSRQNSSLNTGGKVDKITLPSQDGTILLRPIEEIADAVFINGSFARIFNMTGENTRAGFFAYNPKFRGGLKIAEIDIDSGGRPETVVVDNSSVKILSPYGFENFTIKPYGDKYNGGLAIALADLDNDGNWEIITGPENGAANEIKIFDNAGNFLKSWHAFKKDWVNLGINLAAGDVNGDGEIEIIAGAGLRGGPHVKVFNKDGQLLSEFFSYDKKFRGGTYVAVGDLNGDQRAEIITGPGAGGQPQIKVFNYQGKLISYWFPYDSKKRSGVRVAVSDFDNNGLAEVIALTADVFTLSFTPLNKF